MFEEMGEQEAREQILASVHKYYDKYHQKKSYEKGDFITYASRIYNSEEMELLADSMLEFWLTSGKYSEQFESELAEYLDIRYCSLVNSGSSANLLAFMALTSPLLGERRIKPGDEVITVAAGFPTTITPILQFGAVPVFADITIPQYNIDISKLKNALSNKTKAVMLAHTMGNPFDLLHVKQFCDESNLWLIEDNCDALGSEYQIEGRLKKTGTIGDIGTSSFYPPHHITMGEGGAIYTNNPLLFRIIRSMRDWGRDCICQSGIDNLCGHRFEGQYGEMPYGYDHKYIYSHFGYNLKATDMQAAIGCAQLKKLPGFVEKRRKNYTVLRQLLEGEQDRLILPEQCPGSCPSWFGFLITCKNAGQKNRMVAELEKNRIQTRMLFAGNIIKQPCFDEMRSQKRGFRIAGTLENTDWVMENAFWIGLYPGMTDAMLRDMAEVIINS